MKGQENVRLETGQRLSFYKLFKEKNFKVTIPIIQRDYAQGRDTALEVRNAFLEALYNYLDEGKINRDLDFVYGTLTINGDIIDLTILDGQQRLTTLFLLHWYLYQISDNIGKKEEYKNALVREDKSMFSYETRSSSSEFCDAMMNSKINFNSLLDSDKNKNNSLSKTIKNSFWFYLSWEYDPTIQSMLNMLDSIHILFKDKQTFFEKLIDLESPVITFLFLNLKDFKLTDDLYIKMNSRGKPLTPFENFKAKFEQYLENINSNKEFSLSFNNINKKVSLKEYFSYNIDIKWANLFWQYRTLQNRSNSEVDDNFDDELMNFIRVIFTNQYALNMNISSKDKDESLEYLLGTSVAKKRKDYSDVISFYKYKELNALSERGVLYLIDAFDIFTYGNNKIQTYISKSYIDYFEENKAFENALKDSFESNHERLCFHAYVSYLIKHQKDRSSIDQWMRVIHNLSHPENTIIDSGNDVAKAIIAIEELLSESGNILDCLKTDPEISFFSSWQVLEEKIKAHLITKNDEWKNAIEKIEKHKYFNGQIGFILKFSGIVEYYNHNTHCDWDDEENSKYFEDFTSYANKASTIFEESYENRVNNKDFVFERAVLSKGDYLTTASQNRKNLLSTNLVKNNIKRDHSWKRLLRITNNQQWIEKSNLVKLVFDDISFDTKDIVGSLDEICKVDALDSWRKYFVDCPALIEYCQQGFIRYTNENDILLYGQSQSNHMHVEMYSYYIWKKFIEPQYSIFEPFKYIDYNPVKSIDDTASLIFEEFEYNDQNIVLEVWYEDGFYIWIYCLEEELLSSDILKIINEKGFNEENKKENIGIDSILDEVQAICSNLNELAYEFI